MSSPRLYFLGSPKFEADGAPVEMTSAKAVALLAFLAAARQPQPRERLLGLLWAESADEAARKNLRNLLWSIRKALGDNLVAGDDQQLVIDPSAWVDLWEFEKSDDASAASSAALYRGPFLQGLELKEAPDFEIWLTGERERLSQQYMRRVSTEVERLRVAGDWRGVIETASHALGHDELQEPLHRALMEAHGRLGERAEALRQYDALRATLARELGVNPLPETEALRTAILDGTIRPGPASATPLRPSPPPQPTRTAQSFIPFIGREAERHVLDQELQTAANGQVRIILLTGEVGIGKSRLWQEWSASVAPEITTLTTRCLVSTQALPFAPLVELFNNPTICQRLFTTPSPVSPIWLAEVTRLLPDLRESMPNLPAPATLPPEEERRRVFEAFTQCLIALSDQPLVLFVDDMHWADHATLDWLDYVVHRMREQRLMLVAAYRPEDASGHLVRLVTNWLREGLTERISLRRLVPAEMAALVVSQGRDPILTEQAQSLSGGNPYFLIEILRAPHAEIPPVLTELVRTRLDRLPDGARQVLQAASVLASPLDLDTLRRTSGRDEEETIQALDVLLGASILIEREGGYEFAHPLIPTIVQDGMSSARRAFIHRRAAQALQSTYAARLPQVAGQLANHYTQAGDAAHAARFAEMAAERALALAAANEAIDWYRRALASEPTPERQMGLGRVLLRQVELEQARAAFEAALQEFEARGDRRGASRAALNISETLSPSGRFEEAREWISKGLTFARDEDDKESHVLAHMLLGSEQANDPRSRAEAEANLNEAARDAAESNMPGPAAQALFVLGNLRAESGDLPAALEAYKESIDFARAAGNDFQEVLGHNNYAYHALLLGDLPAAHEHIDAALAISESRALRLSLQHLYSTRGEIALAESRWDEAEEWFQRGLVEAEKNNNPREVANARANLGLAARGRGDLDAALLLIDTARVAAARLSDIYLQTKIDLHLTELYLERHEWTAAKQTLARAEARLAGSGHRRLEEWAQRLAAQPASAPL
jgi:DNA-binding SARP family transcriptional activator/tetratricopeptide (TPR) repeat protein